MKLTSSSFLISIFALIELCTNASAFAPGSRTSILTNVVTGNTNERTNSKSNQQLFSLPGGGSELFDLHQSLSHIIDIASSSTLLSDAAAVVEEEASGGWWESYLQIYKSALELVHSIVDQPLRNLGWEQTWGVSIFLFTACKFCFKVH